MRHFSFCLLTTLFLGGAVCASAETMPQNPPQRLALLICNSDYKNFAHLMYTYQDCREMSEPLRKIGFSVIEKRDLSMARLLDALSEFRAKLRTGDVALVYYSGHGFQLDGVNYLMPVDFGVNEPRVKVPYRAYSATELEKQLVAGGARTRVLILDACRNNPFQKGIGAGLAPMQPQAEGTVILFAAAEGKTATDNGLFAKALARHLPSHGASHLVLFKRVQEDIYEESAGSQMPAIYESIVGSFYFDGRPAKPIRRDDIAVVPLPPPQADGVRINVRDGGKYIEVAPGDFLMGCPDPQAVCDRDEFPLHEVGITRRLWVSQTKVTTGMFWKVMGHLPGRPARDGQATLPETNVPRNPSLPVGWVTYSDAVSYCSAIGGRLLTEAEWEYVMRAGDRGVQPEALGQFAWFRDNAVNRYQAVGMKTPNQFGLYDFLGLSWEWVSDYYGNYSPGIVHDPQGPILGTKRVLRGGSVKNGPEHVRYSDRIGVDPSTTASDFGFRCAMTGVSPK